MKQIVFFMICATLFFPLSLLAHSISIVSDASPFTGAIVDRGSYTAPQGYARPYDTLQNLAYQGNGFARAAVSKDTIANYPYIHMPQYINDGLYGNGASWIGATAYSWIKIDLGQIVSMDVFQFGRDRMGYFNDRCIGHFTIEVAMSDNLYANGDSSNDSLEYTQIFNSATSGYAGVFGLGQTVRVLFSEQIQAKFVKITFDNETIAVDEIEIFGNVPEPSCIFSLFLGFMIFYKFFRRG